MPKRIKVYVALVSVAASIAAGLVVAIGKPAAGTISDALILCALAIAGELLGYVTPNRAKGSVSYITYFAAAVLVPSWISVAAVALLRIAFEWAPRRETIKRILNVASHTLMEATAILVYLGLGGTSLAAARPGSLAELTSRFGFAAVVAFTIALFVNNAIVVIAISLSSNGGGRSLWVSALRSAVIMDLLTTPLIFVFAWVYAAYGPFAAAALWVPILGLRQVYRINLELERTNEELLELMVKSLEARDPYTSGHSRRVQHFSTVIARAVGLSERQIEEIGKAALLHDVGKIYEKYAQVLAKQDQLTPDEWTIIQDHPVDGANLVATMTRLRGMVPAIRGHHENWDGTGYPDGLAGELIPLASRIIRFADTIDAMTTQRPYRAPLTEEQVRAEIVRCRGSQFDPMIADKLLSSPFWKSMFTSPATTNGESTTALTIVSGTRPITDRRRRASQRA